MAGPDGSRITRTLLRIMGGVLLVLSIFPVYRGLDTSGDAFRVASVEIAETTLDLALWGSVLVLLLAALLTVFLPMGAIGFGNRFGKLISRPGRSTFALGVGLLAFVLALVGAEVLFQGLYTNMDEIASAIQARYMAAGQLAGPSLEFPEAWIVTNTLMVDEGWVSQYPPSHLAIMAFFYRVGLPSLVGPFLMGGMAWLLALAFPRFLPGREGTARAAALLTALSPFLLFLAGGSLSHLTAGAGAAAIFYTALRARDGAASWAVGVGVAVGMMVCARPLIGLVLGAAIPLSLWGPAILQGRVGWGLRRAGATILGGLPFAILLGLYNDFLFGGPTSLGYLAAFGTSHKLGFHVDPWGNLYNLETALAFTSTDLLALGVQFLETPLPLTLVVGSLLLLRPALTEGRGTLVAWAFLPLLANAFYWFHSSRMMFEAAPAWIFLAVAGVVDFVSSSNERGLWSRRAASLVSWAAAISLLMAVVWGVPTRWRTYSWTEETQSRIKVPALPVDQPSLVFVHSSWNERISSRLQGAGGMRQDSIVSILRRNTNCQLHHYADAREGQRLGRANQPLPEVDLLQSAAYPSGLLKVSPYPEMTIRTREGESFTPDCLRELEADRFGNVALAPLLWQGDLPGLEESGVLFVRDLGPERNERILSLYPSRTPFVFAPFGASSPPELAPYSEAMRALWGSEG